VRRIEMDVTENEQARDKEAVPVHVGYRDVVVMKREGRILTVLKLEEAQALQMLLNVLLPNGCPVAEELSVGTAKIELKCIREPVTP
jgi:hypothetical protein